MTQGVYIAATRAPNRTSWEPIDGGDGTFGRAMGALAAYLSLVPDQPIALLIREQTPRKVRRSGAVIPQEVVDDSVQIALSVESYLASCSLRNDWIERLARASELEQCPDLAPWQPLSDRGTATFTHGFWEALRRLPHDEVRWMERGRGRGLGRGVTVSERARMPELRLGSSAPNAHQAASLRRQVVRVGPVPSPDATGPQRSQAPRLGAGHGR